MQDTITRVSIGVLAALIALGVVAGRTPVVAQPLSSEDVPEAAKRFAEMTFPALADSFAVPGAVFAVVRADGVLALEGFGYADLRTRRTADPEQTIFRVASVSKPVTATAVMRLWEGGAFDLHANIDRYLERVEVPEAFGVPITAHHLLTHTAGFDERLFGSGAPDAAPDLAVYLGATLPGRIYPPGLLHSYSNHGYGLLGMLIEEVGGTTFEAYLEREVLEPLGMTSSTFRQPPLPALRGRLATGYVCQEACEPLPYDYVTFGPAGALQTTAADMARFLAFHLGGTSGVLTDSTRRRMHHPQWQPHPALGGMGYGFFRGLVGRHEGLRHAGGWPGWASQLVLVPEAGLGYFVAVNTDAHSFMEAILEQFAEEVLGGPLPPPANPASEDPLDRYAGTYRLARHVHQRADKVAVLAGMPMPDLRVEAQGDTALVAAMGGMREHLYPAGGPGVFVRPGLDPRRYFFEPGEGGSIARVHTDYASLERIAWWETRRVSLAGLVLCLLIFASAVGAWLLSRLRKRWRAVPKALGRIRALAAAASACHLAFALGLASALLMLGSQGIFHPFPLWVQALFAFPLAGTVLGLLTVPAAVRVWRQRLGPVWSRLHYTAVALAAVFMIPLLTYWNLLGFRL